MGVAHSYNNTILQPLPDALLDLNRLNEKMRERLITSCLLVFLEIQIWATWSHALSLSDNEDGIEEDCSLAEVKDFCGARCCILWGLRGFICILQDEVKEAVEYAQTYLTSIAVHHPNV